MIESMTGGNCLCSKVMLQMARLFRVLGMEIKMVFTIIDLLGFIVAGESTCDHDLALHTQGQWGSETGSSTGPLQHATVSHNSIRTLTSVAQLIGSFIYQFQATLK